MTNHEAHVAGWLLLPAPGGAVMEPDADVAHAAKHGDVRAFEILYETYKRMVWNVAYRMTFRFDEAEDVTQEVFLAAWRALPRYRNEAAFSTWLYRIAVNTTLNHLRAAKSNPVSTDKDVYQAALDKDQFIQYNPEAPARAVEAEQTLARLLARLEPERRLALILREIEGLSYEQIAEAMETPLGTVRSRIARAREELAALAEHDEGKP